MAWKQAVRNRSARIGATLAGVALVLTGCDVGLSLDIDLRPDGTSIVTFVIDADAEFMDSVDVDALRLDDLAGRGWVVVGPTVDGDGSASLTFSVEVATVADLSTAVATLDEGRFFTVSAAEVVASIGTTDYDLAVTVDPSLSAETFSSEAIAAVLGGEPFGITIKELEERAGGPIDEVISISATVRTPGDGDASLDAVSLTLADDAAATVSASSQIVDDDVFVARDIAAAAHDEVDSAWKRLARYWAAGFAVVVGVLLVTRRRRQKQQVPTV